MQKVALTKLKQTGGGGLPHYKEKYFWWDKVDMLQQGNESTKPGYVIDGGTAFLFLNI